MLTTLTTTLLAALFAALLLGAWLLVQRLLVQHTGDAEHGDALDGRLGCCRGLGEACECSPTSSDACRTGTTSTPPPRGPVLEERRHHATG